MRPPEDIEAHDREPQTGTAPYLPVDIEPQGAHDRGSVVPDTMRPLRQVGDQVAGVEDVDRTVDLHRKAPLQHVTILEAGMRDRTVVAARARLVLVYGHGDAPGAVIAHQPADDMLRRLDGGGLARAHDELLIRRRLAGDEFRHGDAEGARDHDKGTDGRRGPAPLHETEHRRAQAGRGGQRLQGHVARVPGLPDPQADRGKGRRSALGDLRRRRDGGLVRLAFQLRGVCSHSSGPSDRPPQASVFACKDFIYMQNRLSEIQKRNSGYDVRTGGNDPRHRQRDREP